MQRNKELEESFDRDQQKIKERGDTFVKVTKVSGAIFGAALVAYQGYQKGYDPSHTFALAGAIGGGVGAVIGYGANEAKDYVTEDRKPELDDRLKKKAKAESEYDLSKLTLDTVKYYRKYVPKGGESTKGDSNGGYDPRLLSNASKIKKNPDLPSEERISNFGKD